MAQAAQDSAVSDPMSAEERAAAFAAARAATERFLTFQRASPEAMAQFQESNTRALIAHALEHVPFYQGRLDKLRGEDGVDLERWLEIEILTRQDLADHFDALTATELPREHGRTRILRTSGTSGGKRVEIAKSEHQDTISACSQFRTWQDHGLDFSANHAVIRAVEPRTVPDHVMENPESRKWGPPWLPFAERGDREPLSVLTPPAQQFEWLNERAPAYLNTMPSNLLALAHHVRDHGGEIPGLKGALTGGEVLNKDVRTQIRKYLGIEAIDALASAECGNIAHQCPDGGTDGTAGYHIEAEICVVEVLREDSTPCRPGEAGLLTTTPLFSHAMPLIRYQSDDWVVMGEPCACGRTLPVLAEIIGRDETLLRFKDGVRVKLEPDSETVFELLGPRRWQIAQTAPEKVEIRIADMRTGKPADLDAMTAYVKKLVSRDIEIACKIVPVLGRAPSGKFSRVIREFA